MRLPVNALCASILLATTSAAQTAVVVPRLAATKDQSSYVDLPFQTNTGRFQHLVTGGSFTPGVALIREFSYRIDRALGDAATGRTQRLRVKIGYSRKTPGTMSETFAANRAGAQTVVFDGTYRLPTQPRLNGPGPWNIRFVLNRPFLYARTNGNLLIELELPERVPLRSWYPMDAFSGSKGGTAVRFGAGGTFARGDRYEVSASGLHRLYPGGQAGLGVTDLRRPYPALAAFGVSKVRFGGLTLPFSLAPVGASGNWLHVSLDVLVPLPLTLDPKGSYEGSTSIPLPTSGLPRHLYAQAVFADAGSNRLGLVWSRALDLTIDSKPGAPTQSVASPSMSAATGQWATRWGGTIGGPVIRLSGAGLR